MNEELEFLDLDATGQADALRRKLVSSEELVTAALARIEATNGAVNYAVEIDSEAALAIARSFDRKKSDKRTPLAGVPITVKDTLPVVGFHCTAGSPLLRENRPEQDAYTVARMRAAGAIPIAKTNVPPFAGDTQTHNELFGTTRNPHDLSRTCGGSSGGSAVAVALGAAAVEIGSDIGGSIRTPAHYCGVVGHRPSYGIVPLHGHIPGMPGTINDDDLATIGPLARSVRDVELALGLMAGMNPEFYAGGDQAAPLYRRPGAAANYRVATVCEVPGFPVDKDMRTMFATLEERLREAGVQSIETVELPFDPREMLSIYLSLLYAVFAAGMTPEQKGEFAKIAAPMDAHDVPAEAAAARGVGLSHADWLQLNQARAVIRRQWRDFFGRFDILLCPAMPFAAPPVDEASLFTRQILVDGQTMPQLDGLFWGAVQALSYLPATAVPVAKDRDGLPLGVQVTAGFREDRTALAFAKVVEDVSPQPDRPSELSARLAEKGGMNENTETKR